MQLQTVPARRCSSARSYRLLCLQRRWRWLPTQASWLSFVEAWFAILSKKCLKRAELADFDAAARTLTDFIATYNAHQAHPFTWRNGVHFYQRLKDKLAAPAPMAA